MSAEQRATIRTRTRRAGTTVGLVLGLLVAGVLSEGAVASAAAPDAWTAGLGDGGNSVNNPGETVITAANAGRVARAWTDTGRSSTPYAPAVVGGVAYHVLTTGNVYNPSTLVASSARTGATLWSLSLPGSASYEDGMAVSGQLAVIPFTGWQRAGGVVAVNLATRRIVWSRDLPVPTIGWMGNSVAGRPYTDGSRVYVSGAGNAVNAYRLGDGALQWTAPLTTNAVNGAPNAVDGLAVGNGVVFTAGDEGLVARDAATGRRLWTGPGADSSLVVAGSRVFAQDGAATVLAFPAAGCGRATCAPLWKNDSFWKKGANWLTIGGADTDSLFVTYSVNGGKVARLSAATGAVQWQTTVGRTANGLVRAGTTVWLLNEYVSSSGAVAMRIVAFSTAATGAAPIRIIAVPQDEYGFPESLAVAGGTLFNQTWATGHLVGYRVPGT